MILGKEVILFCIFFNTEGIIEFLCADGNELEKEGKNSLNQGLEEENC